MNKERIEQHIRVLLIDEQQDEFSLISDFAKVIVHPHIELSRCNDFSQAAQFIQQYAYDLYIINSYPDAQLALNLIKEAEENNHEQPFIVLIERNNEDVGGEAIAAGAMDYLVKSELNPEKLGRCIRYAVSRYKALQMLKANERKYRSVFKSSTDAIFLIDESFQFKDLNYATEELLESSREVLMNRGMMQFIEEEKKEELIKGLKSKKAIIKMPIELVSAKGTKRECLFSASLEDDDEGLYVQIIIHDITEMKKAERIILRQEKRSALDRMLEVLAHEVRNPLNNINLSVEQLSTDSLEPENKVFIDIITRNSNRIDSLITQLLNASRPTQIIEKKVALQDVIAETMAIANDRITLKKIQYLANLPKENVWIKADGEKLKIALLNIFINAIEAMGEGVGKLSVSLKRKDKEVELDIADNGCGICKDRLEHIFDPYFTGKRKGMGLGLSTTLNILQSHNANVDVESNLGEGTQFKITFPEYQP